MNNYFQKAISVFLSVILIACSLPTFSRAAADETDEPAYLYILGDINSDGTVALKDASVIQRVDVGLEFIAESQYPICDVDGDNSCTLSDAYLIQKYTLGIETDYPVNKDGFRIGDRVPLGFGSDSDTDSKNTDIDTYSNIFGTESDTDTYSNIFGTESDTEEPPVVISLSEIQYNLNGDFERENVFPDNWTPYEDRGNMYADQYTGVNNSTSLKLYNQNTVVSRVTNELSGFEPLGEYKLTGKIRGKDITADDHQNGAFLDVGSILGGNYYLGYLDDGITKNFGRGYMIDPNNNWLKGTFDWVEVTCYFIADSQGKADIVCGLHGKGTAYFDDLMIEKVDYNSEPTDKIKFEGEHIGLIMFKSDVADLDESKIYEWIGEIDDGYEMLADLMGGIPHNGDKIFYLSSDEPYVTQYQALGMINPIKWSHKYMAISSRARCLENRKARVAFHEMGHNFDLMYPWRFDGEATAEFKAVYVISQYTDGSTFDPRGTLDIYPTSEYINYISKTSKISYDNTFAKHDDQYSLDAMNYTIYRTAEAVGWDTTKATFRKFSQYYDPLYSCDVGKFMCFMMTLQNTYNELHTDATGREVYDSFPQGDFEYVRSVLAKRDTAAYTPEQDIFMVQFKDLSGNNIGFEFVPYGKAAHTPELPYSDKYGAAAGWSADLGNVTTDMIVTPVYEGFDSGADIRISFEQTYTDETQALQGDSVTVSVTSPFGASSQYRIICKAAGNTTFDNGYTTSSVQSFSVTKEGNNEIYAFVKDTDGTEIMTNIYTLYVKRAVTIYYAGYNNPNIHYKLNGTWTAVPGVPMKQSNNYNGYTHKYTIRLDNAANILTCFNDGSNNWDNNGEKNYSVGAGVFGIKNGKITNLAP